MTVLSHASLFDGLVLVAMAHVRVSSFLLSAPLLSLVYISLPLRIVLSTLLACQVASMISFRPASLTDPWTMVQFVAHEAVIGIALGLTLRAIFSAAALAGEVIASTMGLSMANMINPASGDAEPAVGQLLNVFMMLCFVEADGIPNMIGLLRESFDAWPPHGVLSLTGILQGAVDGLGEGFHHALAVMAPVVFPVFLLNLTTGVLTRLAPQMNIFSIGVPLGLLVGFSALLVGFPAMLERLNVLPGAAHDFVLRRLLLPGAP